MPPIPPERFAPLFRGLDPDERVMFVAALWAKRGWETTTDGEVVVATRDGEQKQILVVNPGRFRTPTLEDADVLVAARDRDAVRAAAEDAGVRYLGPDDVRKLLLYGLERSTAAALFERTFDQPLETVGEPTPTPRERVRAAGASLASSVSTQTNRRHLIALVVVGLFVGAVVGGPTLSSRQEAAAVDPVESGTPGDAGALGERTATPTATATPTTAADGRPPGLGEHALVDHVALADAHLAAVRGNARTLKMAASGAPEAPLLNGRRAWNSTTRIEHPRKYLQETNTQFPGENEPALAVDIYTDGDTKYRQVRQGNETTYQRYTTATTGDANGFAVEVRKYLLRYLAGDDSTVECVATLTGDNDCLAYRVIVTDPPAVVHAEATNYRAVAIVQENGIVATLSVEYTLPVNGKRDSVRFRMAYDDIGSTTVSAPDWLETAKNETSD